MVHCTKKKGWWAQGSRVYGSMHSEEEIDVLLLLVWGVKVQQQTQSLADLRFRVQDPRKVGWGIHRMRSAKDPSDPKGSTFTPIAQR